jgi:hypothetical protein
VKQARRWAGVLRKKEAEGARWVEKSGWLACGMGFSAKLFNYFKSFFFSFNFNFKTNFNSNKFYLNLNSRAVS